jgi:hypothetical protein
MGTVHYIATGHRSFPKERVEIFCGGRVLQLDNFRKLCAFGWPRFAARRFWSQDKGNERCMAAFVAAIRDGAPPPIPAHELFEISRAAINAARILDGVSGDSGDAKFQPKP